MRRVVFVETDIPALQLFREAGKEELSDNPLVRAVIDDRLGTLSLATARPQSERAARVIRIETNDPVRTTDILKCRADVKVLRGFENA